MLELARYLKKVNVQDNFLLFKTNNWCSDQYVIISTDISILFFFRSVNNFEDDTMITLSAVDRLVVVTETLRYNCLVAQMIAFEMAYPYHYCHSMSFLPDHSHCMHLSGASYNYML